MQGLSYYIGAMRQTGIKFRSATIIFIFLLAALILAKPAYTQHKAKLKPGAKGRQCLKCHEEFKKTLQQRSVHPLLKKGECTGCHDPHTSSHEYLLISDVNTLCSSCHKIRKHLGQKIYAKRAHIYHWK